MQQTKVISKQLKIAGIQTKRQEENDDNIYRMEAKHKTVPTSVNDAPMNGDCNHDDDERDWTSNLT